MAGAGEAEAERIGHLMGAAGARWMKSASELEPVAPHGLAVTAEQTSRERQLLLWRDGLTGFAVDSVLLSSTGSPEQ